MVKQKERKLGRPPIGEGGPSVYVALRIPPELAASVDAWAAERARIEVAKPSRSAAIRKLTEIGLEVYKAGRWPLSAKPKGKGN